MKKKKNKKNGVVNVKDVLNIYGNKAYDCSTLTINLADKLRKQADEKNASDCKPILDELEDASNNGEYSTTTKMKVNQANYLATLGLNVSKVNINGIYTISWKENVE